MIGQTVTLDDFQIAGGILIWTALVMVAVGVVHQAGVAAGTHIPVGGHERCEGCGRDVCGCDPNQLTLCRDTVPSGCAHQRVLCTDCKADCGSCRDDLAVEAYVWGEQR